MGKRILLPLVLLCGLTAVSCSSGNDDNETGKPDVLVPEEKDDDKQPEQPAASAVTAGWPAQYGGVMLQGFYWDSYDDSKWSVLGAQADELSQYFQLVWVPNSGKTSTYYHSKGNTMGYDPCFWLDHNSCWGTEQQLRQMIAAFAQKGTGVIEDVVINHKNGLTTWVDFPDEKNGTYSISWDNTTFSAICSNDECNSNGYKTTGARDTGDNFEGYRDLDHTSDAVQQNVKTYLDFLLKELGYVGFRYDMVKGYAARYTGAYNASAHPRFSVGECWDGSKSVVTNWINGTKVSDSIQCAAFDFPLKYHINAAFGSGSWSQLATASLATDKDYARYAVTFVDNHDTYRENDRLRNNVCAANAYILCMPGTPCLFLKHWQQNKGTLKRLIALRRAAGISNQSTILSSTATATGFTLTVQGTRGPLKLVLGTDAAQAGADGQFVLALKGKNFALFAGTSVDLTGMKAVADTDAQPEDDTPVAIPDFCTVAAGETCAFFEAPSSWMQTVMCWAWIDNGSNFTGGTWPGVACEKLGKAANGHDVWKWSYAGTLTTKPAKIIFSSNGAPQTADLVFENGGYYTEDGLQGKVQ